MSDALFNFTRREHDMIAPRQEIRISHNEIPIELKLAVIFFVGVIALVLYVITPTVKATSDINYQDVNSLEAACAYAELYPEKVVNLKELKANCL